MSDDDMLTLVMAKKVALQQRAAREERHARELQDAHAHVIDLWPRALDELIQAVTDMNAMFAEARSGDSFDFSHALERDHFLYIDRLWVVLNNLAQPGPLKARITVETSGMVDVDIHSNRGIDKMNFKLAGESRSKWDNILRRLFALSVPSL